MTKTIVQRIKEDRLAALGLIRVIGGRRFDALPEMVSATTVVPKPGMILLGVGNLSPADPRSYGRENFTQAFTATIVLSLSEYATDMAPDDVRAVAAAEVWRNLCIDRQCGGLAIDTLHEGADPFDSQGSGVVAVTVNFSVEYWTLEGNPFAQ